MKNKEEIYENIVEELKAAGVSSVGVFGSFVRGDETENSDIDLLVDFSGRKRTSLFDALQIQDNLEKKIGRKIDLVTKTSVSPHILPHIQSEQVVLYER